MVHGNEACSKGKMQLSPGFQNWHILQMHLCAWSYLSRHYCTDISHNASGWPAALRGSTVLSCELSCEIVLIFEETVRSAEETVGTVRMCTHTGERLCLFIFGNGFVGISDLSLTGTHADITSCTQVAGSERRCGNRICAQRGGASSFCTAKTRFSLPVHTVINWSLKD